MPNRLALKYPSSARSLAWQYLFPASRNSIDPRSGITRRHHIMDRSVQKEVKRAIKSAGILKHASCHTFRHSDIETTEIYTHVIGQGASGVVSPLER
jgi:integrase